MLCTYKHKLVVHTYVQLASWLASQCWAQLTVSWRFGPASLFVKSTCWVFFRFLNAAPYRSTRTTGGRTESRGRDVGVRYGVHHWPSMSIRPVALSALPSLFFFIPGCSTMSTQLAQHRQAGASSPLSASDSGHLSQSPQSPSNSPASGSAQNSESQLSNVTLNSEDDHIPTVAKGRRDRDNVEIGHQWPPGFGLTRHPSEDSYGAAREAHGKLSDAAVTLFSTIAILVGPALTVRQ